MSSVFCALSSVFYGATVVSPRRQQAGLGAGHEPRPSEGRDEPYWA